MTFEIKGRPVGGGAPTYVIAEAGVNHDGSLQTAVELAEAAAAAGADAVKFQTFDPAALAAEDARLADYQRSGARGAATQREMLEALRLPDEALAAVSDRCADLGITFLSTPFDAGSADLLDRLEVPAFKVGSGELTNLPLLRSLAARGRPLLVSTGMATLDEVAAAVEAVRNGGDPPLALLHCVSSYPTPPEQANLRAMETLRAEFPQAVVGYSDHCEGIEASLAAVALGAAVLERHLTLDRARPGPDHAMSLEPAELAALVRGVRTVEAALGDGRKVPQAAEADTREVARRSLVATRDLPTGSVLTAEVLAAKRPGGGVSPADLERVVGRALTQPLARDERLTEAHLQR